MSSATFSAEQDLRTRAMDRGSRRQLAFDVD
jgi:hypothetical protein